MTSSSDEHVESFWGGHKANVTVGVASCQGCDNDVAFFSLIVVCATTKVIRSSLFVCRRTDTTYL